MRKRQFLWLFMVLPLLFTSCVAKKKYLAMETGRLKAEQKVRELDQANINKSERIKQLIADFETIKSELMESDAQKGNYIDDLKKEIANLSSNVSLTSENLEEKKFAFEFEKRQLNSTISEKEIIISSLQNEIEKLKTDYSVTNSEITQKNFELTQKQSTIGRLESEKIRQDEKLQANLKKIDQLSKEVTGLKSQIAEKDATITRLTNNVKLLKDQIGN